LQLLNTSKQNAVSLLRAISSFRKFSWKYWSWKPRGPRFRGENM